LWGRRDAYPTRKNVSSCGMGILPVPYPTRKNVSSCGMGILPVPIFLTRILTDLRNPGFLKKPGVLV